MIHVLLPAYDEEAALPGLLDGLGRALDGLGGHRVLVVDDGSADATARIAAARSAAGVELRRHPHNRGLGATLRTGLQDILPRLRDDDWVALMDADGTHDPALLPRMIDAGRRGGLDLVIASRFAPGGGEVGLPAHRRLLSRGASAFLRLAYRLPPAVRDVSCGYRVYRGRLLRRLQVAWGERLPQENGFACMAEILLKCVAAGAVVGEVPLVLRYDRKAGGSKMRVLPTVAAYLRLARRMRRPGPGDAPVARDPSGRG